MRHEITTDGRTVWVNSETGMCIGRFRAGLMDVHHDAEGQATGLHCLACASGDEATFEAFVKEMKRHHDIDVPELYRPHQEKT